MKKKRTDAQLAELSLDVLVPSKDQPRLKMHQDVLASIAAAIADNDGAFPVDMAIMVRPRDDGRYEIISGHHRVMAATEAGCETVWAFVKLLEKTEALLALSATNSHRRLSPLEHGRHASKLKQAHGIPIKEYARANGVALTQAYANVWAWTVLESLGGMRGDFAKLPAIVLAELYHLDGDQERRHAVAFAILAADLPALYGQQAVKNIKSGQPVADAVQAMLDHWHAKRLASGRASHEAEAPRAKLPPVSPKSALIADSKAMVAATAPGVASFDTAAALPKVPKPDRDRRAAMFAAEATIPALRHLNDEHTMGTIWLVAYYRARCEALEVILGRALPDLAKLDPLAQAAMVDRMSDRQRQLVEEMKAEWTAQPERGYVGGDPALEMEATA